MRLTEALSYHMEESNKLKSLNQKLKAENEELRGEKEVNDQMIQHKVQQNKLQKKLIKDVRQMCFMCVV